ncbi:MAG: (d)CMP kinase [Clostridia bacterium]|nr:(d)CMP kinase [Clostridia bacterium]
MSKQIRGNVAIDGPAGAGKSTVARRLASRLDYLYIDTGAMYRALTWKALQQGVDLGDERALKELADTTDIFLKSDEQHQPLVYCEGLNITAAIRTPLVSRHVSLVAEKESVRRRLVELQRQMAASNRVVMDGRDIGTYVLPDAPFKFFLTASLTERARRRCLEIYNTCRPAELEQVKAEINQRDIQDSQRQFAPLKPAPDAVIIDSSQMTIEEVVARLEQIIYERSGY